MPSTLARSLPRPAGMRPNLRAVGGRYARQRASHAVAADGDDNLAALGGVGRQLAGVREAGRLGDPVLGAGADAVRRSPRGEVRAPRPLPAVGLTIRHSGLSTFVPMSKPGRVDRPGCSGMQRLPPRRRTI